MEKYNKIKHFAELAGCDFYINGETVVLLGNVSLHGEHFNWLPEHLSVKGCFDIWWTSITKLPKKLMVGGVLNIRGKDITTLPDDLIVGGSLDIKGTGITSLPDNLTVCDSIELQYSQITSLPDNLTVGGGLYLHGSIIASLPENLTIGGNLYIRQTRITSLPDNLTVGGNLDICDTGITSLPDDLTVGKYVYIGNGNKFKTHKAKHTTTGPIEWKGGRYIKADGVFSEVVSRKGNVRRIKKIGSDKIAYLVTDGRGRWAHGDTLEEAKRDLIYKISNTDKSKYENYTLDTEVTFEEGIEMYRVITGACLFGVKNFVENRLKKRKEKYKVSEIISITKGEYGNEKLCEYFKG